tara:strand:- start:25546 stop:26964 length:1419 start_codon:yes stop_codon:yes gene_type:complete
MTILFEQTQDTIRGHNFMLRGIFSNVSSPQDNHGNIQIRTVSYNTQNPQDPQGDGAPSDFTHTAWVFAGHPVNTIAPNNTASTLLHAFTIAKPGNQYIKSDDGFFNFGWHGPSLPTALQHNVYQLTFSNNTEVAVGSAQGYPSIYAAGSATGPTQVLLMGGQTSSNSGEQQAIWSMPKASKSAVSINPSVNTYLPAVFSTTSRNIGSTQGESQNWSENGNDKWYSNEAGDIYSGSFASGNGSRILSDMRNPGNQSFMSSSVLANPGNVGSSGEFSVHFLNGDTHPYHPLVSSVPNSQHELGVKLPFATAQATGGSILYLPPSLFVKGRDMSPAGIGNIAKASPGSWRWDTGVASNADAVWVHGGLYSNVGPYQPAWKQVGKIPFSSMTSAVASAGDAGQWGVRYTQGNSDAKTVFMSKSLNSGSPEVSNWRTFNLQNSITTTTVGTASAAGPGYIPAVRVGISKVGGFAYIG